MQNDPDPNNSAIEHVNAAKVDKILNLQKAQFLAQAESMYLDTKTNSPVKKNPTITVGDEEEIAFADTEGFNTITDTISFHKLPSGAYGHKDLQKGLYNLLMSMGQTNYSATVSAVEPNATDCGTKLLTLLNDTISPQSSETNKQAKNAYIDHRDTFTNNTNFVSWWTTLLLLQATKATLGITDSTRVAAMDDACDTMEEKSGVESRWSIEIIQWRIKSAAKQEEGEARVSSFEHHMRVHQQRRNLANKEKANAVNVKSNYCAWCFKNKGVKWNNHTESTCRNKKRAENKDQGNGGGRGNGTLNRGGCHVCDSKEHFVKDCPLVAKARAFHVCINENATTTNVSAENKTSAGVPSTYPEPPPPPPPPRQTQKRNPTASALMTTALLASAASSPASCTPMMANFDSAATAHMGPDVRFLANAKPSNVGIEKRINFDGSPDGFTLQVFPGHKATAEHALCTCRHDISPRTHGACR